MTSVREELGKMIVSDFKSSLKINTDDLYSHQLSLFKIKQEESLKIFQDNIREYNNKYSQDGPKKIMEDLRNKLEILSGEDANLENLEKILFDTTYLIVLFLYTICEYYNVYYHYVSLFAFML